MNTELIVRVIWCATLVLIGIGSVLQVRFYRRLKTLHPNVFVRLGEPSLILNMSIRNQRRVGAFIWTRGDRELGDPTLTLLVLAIRAGGLTCAVLVVLGFILVVRILGGQPE